MIRVDLRVGHDNSKMAAGWHLERIVIEKRDQNLQWTFDCNEWFDKHEDDKKIERELYPSNGHNQNGRSESHSKSPRMKTFDETTLTKRVNSNSKRQQLVTYKIYVMTSDKLNAGTDANVSIYIYGTQSDSGKHKTFMSYDKLMPNP
jgi:hypothetical protein